MEDKEEKPVVAGTIDTPAAEEKEEKGPSRNDLREKVMDAVYSCLIFETAKIDYDAETVFNGNLKVKKFIDADPYAQLTFVTAMKKRDEIVALVEPKLVKWKFSRLNTSAQAIILVAVAESKFTQQTPKAVAIDCAVDFAKRYLDQNDYKYINAVLDKVL